MSKRKCLVFMVAAALLLSSFSGTAAASTDQIFSLGEIAGIQEAHAGAYGNGLYVVTTKNGGIFYSPDSVKWKKAALLAPDLVDIAYGNGLFVAVGVGGTILTSTDAVTWKQASAVTEENIFEVAYGNGRFVAIDKEGSFLSSADGKTWVKKERSEDKEYTVKALEYGNGMFFATGWNEDYYSFGFTSADGITWTEKQITYAWETYNLAYGNGVFLIDCVDADITDANTLYTTVDGYKAVKSEWPASGCPLIETFADGVFFGIDEYALSWSVNGDKWKTMPHGNSGSWNILIPGQGMLLAISDGGRLLRIKTAPFSSDLKTIETSAGVLSPTFSSEVGKYTITVPEGTTSINVKPTSVNPQATVSVEANGKRITDGLIPITAGQDAAITITVSGTNIQPKLYTVVVKHGADA